MADLGGADPIWRPSASQAARVARAEMLARVRAHFAAQQVLEVETPLLSHAGTTDPNIDSASVRCGALEGYLHTSPEFAMKRLLAAGCGDCYQIARVFRAGGGVETVPVRTYRPSGRGEFTQYQRAPVTGRMHLDRRCRIDRDRDQCGQHPRPSLRQDFRHREMTVGTRPSSR